MLAMLFATQVSLSVRMASLHPARTRPLQLFGETCPKLSEEEYRALAGVWRVELELYDGHSVVTSLHLTAPEAISGSNGVTVYGKVHPLEDFSEGWSPARWSADRMVHAGEAGDDQLRLLLQLCDLCLEGHGRRSGIRCSAFFGTVLTSEKGLANTSAGRFSMQLLLPIKTDAAMLESHYRQRIASYAPLAGDVVALLDDADCEAWLYDHSDELGEHASGADGASDHRLSEEEAAKRAWLARVSTPIWGPTCSHPGV